MLGEEDPYGFRTLVKIMAAIIVACVVLAAMT